MRPDYCKFILSVIGNCSNEAIISDIHQFSIDDWHNIIKYGFNQGITACLYQHIKQRALDKLLPEFALEEMRRHVQDTLAKNSVRFHALKIVLNSLRKNDIPVIVLKGAYLAEHVYGGLGMRSMRDVDLLIHRQDADKTSKVFEHIGIIPDEAKDNVSDLSISTTLIYRHPNHLAVIDLHFAIDNFKFSVDLDELWQRSQPILISGVEARTLSLEDHINHLCYHTAFHHIFICLKHLIDIHLFIETFHKEINWDTVYQIAVAWGNLHNLSLVLDVLNHLTGFEIPAEIQNKLPEEHSRIDAASWAVNQILANRVNDLLEYNVLANLYAIPTWRTKVRHFWKGLTFRTHSVEKNSDNRTLKSYCFSLDRFIYLVRKYTRLIWNDLRHNHELMILLKTKRWLMER